MTINHLTKAWSNDNRGKEYHDRVLLERFIKGIRVQAVHGTKRVYTIFGLAVSEDGPGARPISANVTFDEHVKDENGKETREVIPWIVKDFFSKRMNWELIGDNLRQIRWEMP
jgi:hypothetical protein